MRRIPATMREGKQIHQLSMDTSPEMEDIYFQLLQQKTPAQKIEMLNSINRTVKNLLISGLKQRYPTDDEVQTRIRLAEILHGEHFASVLEARLKSKQSGQLDLEYLQKTAAELGVKDLLDRLIQ